MYWDMGQQHLVQHVVGTDVLKVSQPLLCFEDVMVALNQHLRAVELGEHLIKPSDVKKSHITKMIYLVTLPNNSIPIVNETLVVLFYRRVWPQWCAILSSEC